MQKAHTASGAEMVTVAVNRVPLDGKTESFLDYLSPEMQILPNTAGCYDAEHAIRTARLAREALETDWIKLEVIGDKVTLLPDNEQTLEAARILGQRRFYRYAVFFGRSDYGEKTARHRLSGGDAARRADRFGNGRAESFKSANYARTIARRDDHR